MINFSFLKNLISNIRAKAIQKNLLASIKVGDLVWAKMPLSKKELKNIEKSHRTRPYLVISKDKYNIYGYASSSSSRQNKGFNNYEEYCIPKTRYNQNKNSWISLTKLYKIPVCNLISKHQTISKFDLNNIQKRIELCSIRGINISLANHFAVGDIIDFNRKLFYIYSADNVYLYCFFITQKPLKETTQKIIVNNKSYYANFKELHSFKRTEKLYISNIAYRAEIDTISKQLKQFRYDHKKICT